MVLIWLIKGVFYKVFFIIYKNEWVRWLTYYQRNRNGNKAKDYYENDKERLREKARDKYRGKIIYLKKNKIVFNCDLIMYAVI